MSTWNWKRGLLGAGLVLAGGCNLGDLVDEEAFLDKFKGIQVPQAGIDEITKKIGAEGGQAVTMDGAVSIPEGALDSDVDIKVSQADPDVIVAPLPSVMKPVSAPVSFKPDGTQFDEPVTLSLFHDKSADPPEQPVVVWLENDKDTSWDTVKQDDTYTDNDKGVTQVVTKHFSIYAVVDCQAAGPLAHLCQDLIEGKITLKDVLEAAPEAEDTWGNVVDPRPGTDDPADAGTPSTDGYDCRRCLDIAQKCQQDPRQDICQEAAEPCSKLAPECAGELTCEQLQLACDADQPAACDEFARRCGSPTLPRCEKLSLDCDRGIATACAAYDRECSDTGPDCAKLAIGCEAGDQRACADLQLYCGAISECDLAAQDCANGDQAQCDYYDAYCGGNVDANCQRASAMCEGGDAHACELYDIYCTGGNPNVDPCTGANDACYVGDVDACDYYAQNCSGGPSACDQLLSDCIDNGNQDACNTYDLECAGDGGTPDCSVHYDACYGPAASVDDCYAYDACMGYPVDPNCSYQRTCNPAGCEGNVCWEEQCYVDYVCSPPPPSMCDQLYMECYYDQIAGSCDRYNTECVGGGSPDAGTGGTSPDGGVQPPPPEVCQPLWDSCQQGNTADCDQFYASGCPEPPPPPL